MRITRGASCGAWQNWCDNSGRNTVTHDGLPRHQRFSPNLRKEAAVSPNPPRVAGWPATLAVSTEILLEYEEVTIRLTGPERWRDIAALLDLLDKIHGNIRQTVPQYRFAVITLDPDDNKFCDCAIAAEADFVVTDDAHFGALKSAGYKPKPIAPEEFIRLRLSSLR